MAQMARGTGANQAALNAKTLSNKPAVFDFTFLSYELLMAKEAGFPPPVKTTVAEQRRILGIALTLNASMFVVGLVAGLIGQSSGLIADSLDMLADASGYMIALTAVGRSRRFKANSALFSGSALLVLGAGVLVDVLRRVFTDGQPMSFVMIGAAILSLAVNTEVLRMLDRFRDEEIHLRATYIDTRVDVVANVAVIGAGFVVLVTGFRFADLVVGAGIGVYVLKEALELMQEAREERAPGDS